MNRHVLYGLVGYPLGHSFSPGYFNAKFLREGINAEYRIFPLEDIAALKDLIQAYPTLMGLNVTIPHKQAVIPLLDEVDEGAAAVGAVNCIDIKNGKTTGYNTDVIGFEQSLTPLLTPAMTSAIVLGTGGAAMAVMWVLRRLGIDIISVSRIAKEGSITYTDVTVEMMAAHKLIINTTPAGMYPHVHEYPTIPYEGIGHEHLLYDLVYNPEATRFMQLGLQKGASVKNGLEMLHLQAEAAWAIWNRL